MRSKRVRVMVKGKVKSVNEVKGKEKKDVMVQV